MATQSRGAPYPLAAEANNTPANLQALALWVNDRPGVAALTTTQRNALTGVELWDGRIVLNTTTDRLNRYDLGTTTWVQIPDSADIAGLLTASTPATSPAVAGVVGVAAAAAKADHVHPAPAWQAYTPTLAGGSTVGTGGTLVGRWVRIGNTVHFWARVTFGTGFTLGGGIQPSLPVARSATPGPGPTSILLVDAGGNFYNGGGNWQTNNIQLYVTGTNGAAVTITTTVPFTWAATDYAEVAGTYEAA